MGLSKTRNWGFVIYPESAPDGWQDLLADTQYIKSLRGMCVTLPVLAARPKPSMIPQKSLLLTAQM